MVGTFVMFEMPTGDADKGLGVGKTWYKLAGCRKVSVPGRPMEAAA